MGAIAYVVGQRPGVPALCSLREAVGWSRAESDYPAAFDRYTTCIAAYDEHALVGWCAVVSDGVCHAFLVDVIVAPAWQRRGIGRELVRRAVDELAQRGFAIVHVDFIAEHEPFYRSCGFRPSAAGIMELPVVSAPRGSLPRLYGELASWWPILSPPAEYVEEATFYRDALADAVPLPFLTCLELGSGGGHIASHFKAECRMTLVDQSPEMLAMSRELNPDCEHVLGDMRTIRLGRLFDRVFVHDAICYMLDEDDLRRAIETAFVHCKPGGAALFAPDYVRENFADRTDHGGSDGSDRALRYLEWVHDPDPYDTTYTVDYAYILRSADGTTRVEHDVHVEGLFSRATWMRLLAEAGFAPERVPFEHSEVEDPCQLEVFLARRPV